MGERLNEAERALAALDRLADQAVNTARSDRGRGEAIQDRGIVAHALAAVPPEGEEAGRG